jgi:hypothetical protein
MADTRQYLIFVRSVFSSDVTKLNYDNRYTEEGGNFSLLERSGTYDDYCNANHGYIYFCRELLLPSNVAFDYQNPTSSFYNSFEINNDDQFLSVGYNNDSEKEWTESDDAFVENDDYLMALLGQFIEANDLSDELSAIVASSNWAGGDDLLSSVYFAIQSLYRPEVFNTNFTNNGAKENYTHADLIPIRCCQMVIDF